MLDLMIAEFRDLSLRILYLLQAQEGRVLIPRVDDDGRGWLDHPELTDHIVLDGNLYLPWVQDKPFKKLDTLQEEKGILT